jgi:hypothetical protein
VPAGSAAAGGAPKKEVVVLPQVDASGRAMPGAFGRQSSAAGVWWLFALLRLVVCGPSAALFLIL